MLVLGIGLAIAPLFIGKTAMGKVLSQLLPVGLLMVVVAGALLWAARRGSNPPRLVARSETGAPASHHVARESATGS
jgi:hypothetical protein